MFGNRFKAQVKRVIADHFSYPIGPVQAMVLPKVCRHARQTGVNEYDAAMFFMSIMMSSADKDDSRAQAFVDEHTNNIFKIIHLSTRPREEIIGLINDLRTCVGLDCFRYSKDQTTTTTKLLSFEDWVEQFTISCERIRPGLGRLIKYVDNAPLRRAYSDNVCPSSVAGDFAPNFDIESFGKGC